MPGFKGGDFTYEGQPQLGSALKPGEVNSSDPAELYISGPAICQGADNVF